jgi:hypothetical protein
MKGMTETVYRSEKDEEADCDALVRSMHGAVRRYSQPRASMQTAGISDREYVLFGGTVVLRWEVKAEDGKLSQEQYDLLCEDHRAGRYVGCGTLADLGPVLVMLRHVPEYGRQLSFRLVQLWAARGLRRSKKLRTALIVPTPPRGGRG